MPSRKKIFDITPPRTEEKKEAEEFLSLAEKEPVKGNHPSRFGKGFIIFLAFLILFVLGCYVFIRPSAQIKVWPKTDSLSFETSLQASILATETDFSRRIIPATPLEIEETTSQEFRSSVTTTAEKARGIIRVYNQYYLPITLVKGTHFLASDSDVEFLSQKRITIPAKGFTDVGVIALSAGEEYNVGPCAFSIPNLRKFSPPRLYYDITGKSFSKMTGGRVAKVFKVTEEDLDQAKKALEAKALRESESSLQSKNSSSTLILKETINQEVLDISPLPSVGQEVKNFVLQIKTKTRALGIEKTDLEKFAREEALSQIPSQKELSANTLDVDCKSKNIDMEKGKATLVLSISADVYPHIDKESLKMKVTGELPEEAKKIILDSFPEISKVEITVMPIWQRQLPKNTRDIKIEIKA